MIPLGANHILIIIFFTLSLPLIIVQTQCSSVKQIQENADFCDNQNVTLVGKVTNLNLLTSKSGNKYTTFLLEDNTDKSIKVFSYLHLKISEGDQVNMKGVFHKTIKKGEHTFYFEITTNQNSVSIVKEDVLIVEKPFFISKEFYAIFLFILVLVGYIIYKKYKPTKHKIGRDFESYVLSLFDPKDWIIVTKTGDFAEKLGRKVESDSNPDLVMKHRTTNKVIAFECKYRSAFKKLNKGERIFWAQEYQIKNYKVYQEKTHVPVIVVIGVGRKSTNPQHLYSPPLYALKYSLASKEYLERFERETKNNFTLEEFKKFYNKLK